MSKKLVRRTVDTARMPMLTDQQQAEIEALSVQSDDAVDISDIPVLPEDFWKNAIRGRFYRPTKTSTTVRIDSDVLAWLRSGGDGYQTRLNAILRRAMLDGAEPR